MTMVLVTGATGFIGKHLIDGLLKEGYNIRALVRNLEKAKFLEEKGVELFKGDTTKPESLRNIAKDVEVVIHLAALMRFHAKWDDLYRVNVLGTENLLKELVNSEVEHFIYTSSTEAIGPVEKIPADETAPLNPTYEYGMTKVLGEKIMRKYYLEYGFPATIVRPSGVYGPGDLYVTLSVVRAIKRGLMKRLPKGGENYIQFVFVKDVVQGFLKVLKHRNKTIGETYIITSADYYTYKEAFTIIANILGVSPPKGSMPVWAAKLLIGLIEKWNNLRGKDDFVFHVSVVNDMLTNRVYSCEKARRELNYEPKYKFEEGMKITIEWYKKHGYI